MAGKKRKGSNNKKQRIAVDDKSDSAAGVCTRSMTRMNINKLNDDCLLTIFSYLSKRQLIGIERVCKKWKELVSGIWATETLLNSEKITEITKSRKQIKLSQLENILIKCGEYVKTFNLDCVNETYIHERCTPDEIVCLIAQYCKNLESISLHCGYFTESGLSVLQDKIVTPKLESIDIDHCNGLNEMALERILKKGPNLNKLMIDGNRQIIGDSIANSGRAFKKLGINSYSNNIKISNLEKILQNSPELEVFHGTKACTFKMLNLFPLREHLVELIINSTKFFEGFPASPLPFPNLRTLNLNGDSSVNNDILSQFYKWFPNLESVDLTECEYKKENEDGSDEKVLNNDGIKELSKLPKLKSLNLNGLHFLKTDPLIYLALNTEERLESLACYWCNKLRDPDMIKFVSLCPRLTYLDVSYCQRITSNLLDGILVLLPLRTSKRKLKVRITHSANCDLNLYEKFYPLLEIEEFGELDEAHFDYDESEYEYDEYYY